ncbi:Crp/Fnr family transcriptional regulator [Flavitalea antarctica]
MEALRTFIKSKVPIIEIDLDTILAGFREITVKKGKLLHRQGHIIKDYFFVLRGGLRIYMDTGEEKITGWIALENDFFTELSSLKKQMPCRFSIQAIEDCIVLAISTEKMEEYYRSYPVWQQFGREVWEDAFLKVVDGIISYQTLTAEERYRQAMEKSDLLQRVPLKDLSSFLGVTPNSLSRIRKNLK